MNENKQGGRGRQAYLYIYSVKKVPWFFKHQTELFMVSDMAVAKCVSVHPNPFIKLFFLWKRCRHFLFIQRFVLTCKYVYCHCIYNCIKNIDLLCSVYEKIYFVAFHAPIFHSEIHKRCGIYFEREKGVTH